MKNMNKQKILLIIVFIIIISVSIGISLFLFKKSPNQKIISSPCKDISEEQCFTKLSGCIKTDSASDFLNKEGFKITLNGWPEKWTSKITPPIQTNFPNAEIFLNIQPLGGGDHGSFPFIKLGNSYCDLNEENSKIVFAPIKSREDALKYYIFLRKDLGSATAQSQFYITKQEDYNNANITYNVRGCSGNYKEKLQNEITETKEIEDGYLLNLVGFNYIGQTGFFESEVKIKTDGTIENVSTKTLLDCGPGAVF